MPSVASPARLEPRPAAQARLACADAAAQGWLLDGYPRSAEQAEAIQEAGIRPDIFILIQARDVGFALNTKRFTVNILYIICLTKKKKSLAALPDLRPCTEPCGRARHDAGLPCAVLPGRVEGPALSECLPASPLLGPAGSPRYLSRLRLHVQGSV